MSEKRTLLWPQRQCTETATSVYTRYVENAAQVVISNETPSPVYCDDAMGDLGLYILSQKSKTGSGSQV